jgi:hypothetical protein
VRLPLVGIPWLPRRAGPLVRGLHSRNGTTLLVTSGAGTSILPVRFDCPPEVVLLTWHREDRGPPAPREGPPPREPREERVVPATAARRARPDPAPRG